MPSTSPGGVPIYAPFVDDKGNISRVWINFLAGLGLQVPVPVVLVDGLNPFIFVGISPEIIITGPAAAFSIGGFSAGVNGQRLHVLNYTDQPMTLENLSVDSPPGDQIVTLTGADVTLAGKSSATFIYYNVSPISDVNPPGAWVLEAAAPSSGGSEILEAVASGGVALNDTAYHDVPGCTVTLDQDGDWVIDGWFDIVGDPAANACFGRLVVAGVDASGGSFAVFLAGAAGEEVSVSMGWKYTNSGSNIAKLQAKATVGGTAANVNTNGSKIRATFIG